MNSYFSPTPQMLSHTSAKLLTIQKQIEALVRFEVEDIEDVDIYSSPGVEGGPEAGGKEREGAGEERRAAAALAKMERANRALQFQLKEAMRENKELQVKNDGKHGIYKFNP